MSKNNPTDVTGLEENSGIVSSPKCLEKRTPEKEDSKCLDAFRRISSTPLDLVKQGKSGSQIFLEHAESKNSEAGSPAKISNSPEQGMNNDEQMRTLAELERRHQEALAMNEKLLEREHMAKINVIWDFIPNGKVMPHCAVILIQSSAMLLLVTSFFLSSFNIDLGAFVTLVLSGSLYFIHAAHKVAAYIFKLFGAKWLYESKSKFYLWSVRGYSREQPLHWSHQVIATYMPPMIIFTVIISSKHQLTFNDFILFCALPIFMLVFIHNALFPIFGLFFESESTNGDLMISYCTALGKCMITRGADNSNPNNADNDCEVCCCL